MLSDPDITHGHFKVYPRTDGKWIVFDTRRPVGERTVMVFKKLHEADQAAQKWHKEGHG